MARCKYCGKEMPDNSEKTKFYLNDEFLFEEYCCDDCNDIIQKATNSDDFGEKLLGYLEELRNNWEPGTKENTNVGSIIKIIELKYDKEKYAGMRMSEDDYSGKTGVVENIDDAGQLHGTWGSLAVIPEVDKYFVLKKVEKADEEN